MTRATVSSAAERTLDDWLDQLMRGQIQLTDLPLCVAAWFHAGAAYERAAQQLEITRLERENNWLHYQLLPVQQRKALIEQRLAERLSEASEDEWGRIEQLLRHIANHSEDAIPLATEEQHDRNQQAA